MIITKKDLKEYIKEDNWYYDKHYSAWDQKLFVLLRDPQYLLRKYKYHLRKEEFFFNNPSKLHTILRLIHLRKKNILGNKLGVLIPPNTFGKGLMIMHHGSVIVNPNVKVGDYCILHGNNCLGNNGKTESTPVIGNHFDLGIGASVIGKVYLDNGIHVGANAVVNKSFEGDNLVLVGVPAIAKKWEEFDE